MKTLLLFAAVAVFPTFLQAQTATADDTTSTGSKVGTGTAIDIPVETGPKSSPENPTSGAIIASPSGKPGDTTPVTPANGGAGTGSSTQPVPPGAGPSIPGSNR